MNTSFAKYGRILLLGALFAIASALGAHARAATPTPKFTVNQFILVQFQYVGPRELSGISTYGPAAHAVQCERAGATGSDSKGPAYVVTCLHIAFGGPLPAGAVALNPTAAPTIGFAAIAIEYGPTGRFVGAQPLHGAIDAPTCMAQSKDLLQGYYKDGSVPHGNSLLIYCVGIPEENAPAHGHAV